MTKRRYEETSGLLSQKERSFHARQDEERVVGTSVLICPRCKDALINPQPSGLCGVCDVEVNGADDEGATLALSY